MINCFVSYCGEDAPDVHVKALVDSLKQRTGDSVEFQVFYEQEFGRSLTEFMKGTLLKAEAVLLLLGPGYRRRIDHTMSETGAYQEYDTIIYRLEDRSTYGRPKLIPVYWAGNQLLDAVPKLIHDINPRIADLSFFRAHGVTHQTPFIPAQTLASAEGALDSIAKTLRHHAEVADREVVQATTGNLQKLLLPGAEPNGFRIEEILQRKYEHGRYDAEEFKERYFTSTRFFRRLKARNVGLISGRKGSGKTTLVQIRELEADRDDYYPVIDVEVDGWNLHYLIQSNVFQQATSDFEYADLDVRFFDFVWTAFICLCMCESLLRADETSQISAGQLVGDKRIADQVQELHLSSKIARKVDYAALFQIAVNAARQFIQNVVDNSDSKSEEIFRVQVIEGVSIRNFLFSLFGAKMRNIRENMFTLGRKRFLFSFDRFDTEIQQYRKENIERVGGERRHRAQREIDWLSSLTLVVEKTLRPDRLSADQDVYEFLSNVKFLIVLPYDRAIELRQQQRDSVAAEAIEEIRWQPKELLTMLRKRLQMLYAVPEEAIDKERYSTPEERFNRCLQLAGTKLPDRVYVPIDQRRFEFDLFLEVLRHSLFRPRDVMIYYAAILAYHDTMKRRNRKVDVDVLREIISSETRTIVNFEFVGELRDTWLNIEEVLGSFKGGPQILSSRELEEAIGPIPFRFFNEASEITQFHKKIEFLYDVGFLGFRSKREAGASNSAGDFTFSFVAKQAAAPFDSRRTMRLLDFAIHPLFIESLFLVVNGGTPVLLFSWKSLEPMDRVD